MNFAINENKGFRITFKNGWAVSIQFGEYNYAGNYYDCSILEREEKRKARLKCEFTQSHDAETALFDPEGEMTPYPYTDSEKVQGYQYPEQVLELLNYAASRPPYLYQAAYTNHPFGAFGDIPAQPTPVRECTILFYEGANCHIKINGCIKIIKACYVYDNKDCIGRRSENYIFPDDESLPQYHFKEDLPQTIEDGIFNFERGTDDLMECEYLRIEFDGGYPPMCLDATQAKQLADQLNSFIEEVK